MHDYNDEYVEKVFELIPEANFVAVDKDGAVFWYKEKPKVTEGCNMWFNMCCNFLGKVNINGLDWKDSLRERKWKPKLEEWYYFPAFTNDEFQSYKWDNCAFDFNLLKQGVIFRTKEEAIACSKKMLEAVKK